MGPRPRQPRMTRPVPTLPLLLAASALPAGAQSGVTVSYGDGVYQLPLQHAGEVLGRSVHGDLDGTAFEDLAYLAGQELRVAHDPGTFAALSIPATGVLDVDVLPIPGAAQLHGLVVLRPEGVFRCWFTRDEEVAVGNSAPISLAPALQGARLVRVRDVDGVHGSDLVIVQSAGTRVSVLLDDGAGGWIHDPGADVDLGQPAVAIEVYRPLASGPCDVLAAATTNRLELWSLTTGVRLAALGAAPLVSTALERFGQRTVPSECLAWLLTDPANGIQFLAVYGQAPLQTVYLPGESAIPALESGDHDGDGKDDLLLNNAALYKATVLLDLGPDGAPPSFGSFAQGGALVHDVPGHSHDAAHANPAFVAKPALFDLENDGDVDVCVPTEENDEVPEDALTFFRNDLVPPGVNQPELQGVPAPNGEATAILDVQSSPHQLSFVVHVPVPPPSGATHLEVRAFRKPDLDSPTAPDGASELLIELVPGQAVYPVTVPIVEPSGPPYPSLHFLHASLIGVGGTVLEAAFPPVNAAFLYATTGTSEGLDLILYVLWMQLAGTSPIPVVLSGGGAGNGTDFSGIYLVECVPDFPLGDPPTPLWQ